MTKEEAIVIIDSLNPDVVVKTSASDDKIREAIKMALEALSISSILSGLDEVAEDQFDDAFYKFLDKKDREVLVWSEEDLLELAKCMFDFGKKVGAEWMAGQGVNVQIRKK